MKKVLMLATTAAMIEQFNKNNIELLNEMGYVVDVAGNFREGNPISDERLEEFKVWIKERGGSYYDITAVRKPTALKENVGAYRQVVNLLRENKYAFVHVHTPIGSIIGRLAAHKIHTKIIYTAHGFHFFKGAPLKNWLLYYPAEWLCSWWTDVLITINQEDYQRACKHMHAKRTEYIPGIGIDTEAIANVVCDKKAKRKELGIPEEATVLISVGELIERKNHKVIIDALGKMQNKDIYLLIVGKGALKESYEKLISQYGLENNILLLGFRNDIVELCKMSDCFIFPSFQEGLSVALMEAMACGLPVICSEIRGNVDLIEDGVGGLYVSPISVDMMKQSIERMNMDREFMEQCELHNISKIRNYDLIKCMQLMKKVYKTT